MKKQSQILIVEDERIVAEDIKRSLTHLGYSVVGMASSGRDAIQMVRQLNPDLILMDIVIKGKITGIETSHQLRVEFDIPVVYLTAHADSQTFELAKATDPFGYIIKPFSDRELQSTIEMALYKHSMERKLRESEAWFSTTLDSMADGVIATDKSSKIIVFNPGAEKLTGWKRCDALGCDLNDVLFMEDENSGDRIMPVKRWKESKGAVRTQHLNMQLKTLQDQIIPIDESTAPIRNLNGDRLGTVLVLKDITLRRKAQEEVQEERDFINTLLHVSPAFYVAIDGDGRVIMMNEAVCKALGYTREELESRIFVTELLPLDDQDHAAHRLQELMKTREPFDGETRVLTRDGRERLVAWHGKPVMKKRGEMDFYFVMGMDITDRRETERALRHSEERYRGLFETMAQGVVYFDGQARIVACNPAAEAILGCTLSEMVGLSALDPCWDAVAESGESIDEYSHPVMMALARGEACTNHVIGVLTPEAQRRWLLMDATPVDLMHSDLRSGAVFVTFTNITWRKEMELALSQRNTQLRGLNDLARRVSGSLDLGAIGEAALDEVLRIIDLDAGIFILFNTSNRHLALHCAKGFQPEGVAQILEAVCIETSPLFGVVRRGDVLDLPAHEAGLELIFSARRESEHRAAAHLLLVPVREGTKIIGAMLLGAQKNLQLADADTDFLINVGHHVGLAVHNGRLYHEANAALEKLKVTQEKLVTSEKLAGLGAMASNVVHEIGNPLAAISNSIQVLQGRLQLEGPLKELLNIIGWETDRLERSIIELREFSKPKRLHFVPCQLGDVVRKAVLVLDQDVELTSGRKIVQAGYAGLTEISIDPDAMEQVAINLIKNSLQAVDEGGRVEINLKKETIQGNPYLLFEVVDNGPGIEEKHIEQIFEPYFSTKARGMGLGMHIVKTHVEAHGGFMSINSEWGEGTAVGVHLPILRGHDD